MCLSLNLRSSLHGFVGVLYSNSCFFFIGVSPPDSFVYISFSISSIISSELLLVMSYKSSAQSAEP